MATRKYNYYHQCDEPWGVLKYAKSGDKISKKGCLISCIGMITDKDPGEVNKWLNAHKGYTQNNDFIWNSVKDLGITFVGTVSLQEAKEPFDKGKHVILKLTSQHYVLMTGYTVIKGKQEKITKVTVLDPGHRNITSYDASDISVAKIYK